MSQARIRREHSQSSTSSGIFKYLVPVSIAIIVIVIIARILFSSGGDTTGNKIGSFVTISPQQEQSEIYIYMSGDSKKKIDGPTKMYSTDSKLQVTAGEAAVAFEGNQSKVFADKLAEVKYDGSIGGNQSFTIQNGCIWLEANDLQTTFTLRNFKVLPGKNSVLALCENAVSDTIYVLRGEGAVQSNAKTATVGVGQQLMILNSDVSSPASIADKINPLEDFFKTSDLFIKHNGSSYLLSSSDSGSSLSGSLLTSSGLTTLTGSNNNLTITGKRDIIISFPQDESSVDNNTIDITGNIADARIVKITMNEKDAAINISDKTFIFKGFTLDNNVNDIVYKTFDKDANLISKGIFTVYLSKSAKKDTEIKATVTTYPLSDKDFRIVAPTDNPYKTTDDVVRIEGRVNKGTVKYITINDFRLTKFVTLGTYWYYFANKDFGTMNDGINLYTIKYYGLNDELLFTNLFTIVKEPKTTSTDVLPSQSQTGTTSGTGSEGTL